MHVCRKVFGENRKFYENVFAIPKHSTLNTDWTLYLKRTVSKIDTNPMITTNKTLKCEMGTNIILPNNLEVLCVDDLSPKMVFARFAVQNEWGICFLCFTLRVWTNFNACANDINSILALGRCYLIKFEFVVEEEIIIKYSFQVIVVVCHFKINTKTPGYSQHDPQPIDNMEKVFPNSFIWGFLNIHTLPQSNRHWKLNA